MVSVFYFLLIYFILEHNDMHILLFIKHTRNTCASQSNIDYSLNLCLKD